MNKKEFLDILRQALEGEVDNSTIEKNIKFYSDYISSVTDKSEEEVIEEIGDPRLIAKTIIETEKVSKTAYNDRYDSNNYEYRQGNYNDYSRDENQKYRINRKVFKGTKWYYKILSLFILFIFLVFIFNIGLLFIKLLSVFFVPVLLGVLLLIYLRNR